MRAHGFLYPSSGAHGLGYGCLPAADHAANACESLSVHHRQGRPLIWQGGYGAFSLWERDVRTVIRYVENQRDRHLRDNWIRIDRAWPSPTRGFRASALRQIDANALLVDDWERTHAKDDVGSAAARACGQAINGPA